MLLSHLWCCCEECPLLWGVPSTNAFGKGLLFECFLGPLWQRRYYLYSVEQPSWAPWAQGDTSASHQRLKWKGRLLSLHVPLLSLRVVHMLKVRKRSVGPGCFQRTWGLREIGRRADAAKSGDERQEQGSIRHSENWYPSLHDATSQSSSKSEGSAENGRGSCSIRDRSLKCFSR